MRGLFVQQPFEFRLDVKGDSFSQGQEVSCSLSVKNHLENSVVVATPTLILVNAILKKVKARDPSAFEVIRPAELERGVEVVAKGHHEFPFLFILDANAPITDKGQSLYLLYGNSPDLSELGQLLLTVTPHPHIRAIFDTFTTVFSFVSKGESWKDGWTTVKLKPPESARMSFVEELHVAARFGLDALEMRYVFTVKKFDASLTTVGVKRGKAEVFQTWPSSEYLFGGGFVQQPYVEKMIDAALHEVSSGF